MNKILMNNSHGRTNSIWKIVGRKIGNHHKPPLTIGFPINQPSSQSIVGGLQDQLQGMGRKGTRTTDHSRCSDPVSWKNRWFPGCLAITLVFSQPSPRFLRCFLEISSSFPTRNHHKGATSEQGQPCQPPATSQQRHAALRQGFESMALTAEERKMLKGHRCAQKGSCHHRWWLVTNGW